MTLYECLGIDPFLMNETIPADMIIDNIDQAGLRNDARRFFNDITRVSLRASFNRDNHYLQNLVTMTIELDQEVYDQVSELFQSLGTTIEDMAVAFLKFCVIPENLPLLKAYLGIENAPAEAGAKMELHHRVFQKVFNIAAKHT